MRMRVVGPVLLLVLAVAAPARADVILTAQNLNEALKNLQRWRQQTAAGMVEQRAQATYDLALEAEELATLMSDEVIAHGMQEKALLDLAVERSKEVSVVISYNPEKRKFFYDGAAFRDYLKLSPKGPAASRCAFKIIEGEFYQSEGTEAAPILAAVKKKQEFLVSYPTFELNSEIHLMLAIDYRDLFRIYDDEGNAAKRAQYRDLVRQEYRTIMRQFPGSEQAGIARKLLDRFEEQLKQAR